MDWYLWVLLGLVVYNFLFLFIWTCKENKGIGSFKDFIFAILVSIMFTVIFTLVPFLWIYIFVKWIDLLYDDIHNREETFTIHNLTKENKITLRQMGFQEGKVVSSHNLDYSGFRLNDSARIIVLYNGRVLVQGRQDENTKTIVSIIKKLPEPKPIVKEAKESEVNE